MHKYLHLSKQFNAALRLKNSGTRKMRIFTEHPESIGETYGQHFRHAGRFGFAMITGGIACLLHALFPWLCVTTGSDEIRRLYRSMVTNRADLIKLDEYETQIDWVI